MSIFDFFKKIKVSRPKPKYKIGSKVRWDELDLIVNDYVYDEDDNISYILFDKNTRIFYENVYEEEIER